MRVTGYLTLFTCILLLATAICPAQEPAAAPEAPAFTPERVTGRIVNTGGGGSAHFTLQIDGLTTDEQMSELRTLLKDKGENDVIKVMEKMPTIGWMRIADSIRYTVAVIDSIPTPDGGRILRVVTPRSLAWGEIGQATRSRKYRFGIAELFLDAEGKGEGAIIAAARFMFNNDGDVVVESYGIQPVRVLNAQAKPHSGE